MIESYSFFTCDLLVHAGTIFSYMNGDTDMVILTVHRQDAPEYSFQCLRHSIHHERRHPPQALYNKSVKAKEKR